MVLFYNFNNTQILIMKYLKKISISICLVSIVLILNSCGNKCDPSTCNYAVDQEAINADIAALEASFSEAMNNQDIDALMAYYADDAQSMTPNKPTLMGKEAIKADVMEEWAEDTVDTGVTASMNVTMIWASGDIAVEQGTWNAMKDGEAVASGKYMSLFEKRDGKYVCIRDIWNSDKDDKDDESDEGDKSDKSDEGDEGQDNDNAD